MLINLVHIAYMRMVKSRAFLAGAIISVFGGLISTMVIRYFMIVIGSNEDIMTDNPYLWQNILWNTTTNIVWIFTMANVVFSICDYYKYREMVNIEGAIRSRAKLCISEVLGLALFALTMAIVPILVTLLGIPFDQGILFSTAPATVVGIYIATAIMIALQSMPIFCFAKIFRRKSLALIGEGVYIMIKYMLIVFTSGFIQGFKSARPEQGLTISSEVLGIIINPSNMLCGWAMGGTDAKLLPILGAIILYAAFWIICAILFSKRRYEL